MITQRHKGMRKEILTILIVTSLYITTDPMWKGSQTVEAKIQVQDDNTSNKEPVAKIDNFTFSTKEQISSTISQGMDDPYSDIAVINEFWGSDSNYHIIYNGEDKVYIDILDRQMVLLKTIEISKDLPLVGNAIQDKEGNYYIVYGKYDSQGSMSDADAGNTIVMSVVQYNSCGELLNKLTYTGKDSYPSGGVGFCTKEPFNFANCELAIDTSGILVCRYGRVMYNGHQSSHTIYVNTQNMTRLIYTSPYTSHSFDQKLLVTSDGGYLFAERGDAYDRGIVISKISSTAKNARSYPSFIPFHFKNGYIYQTTYASLAGIAECSNGYVLAGASEKTLSYDAAKDPEFNESRNIFMQVFSKNFTSSSTNDPNVQLLQGESRIAQGTYVSGTGNCEENAKDYGILWLTDYTGSYYASNPKLISLGEDKLLIMWEKKKYLIDDYWSDQYIEAYYMVVSSDGSVLITQTVIQDERLAQYEEPDYVDGCIYWTTSDGESNNYIVHRLSIGETMAAKIHVSAIKAEKSESVARAGEKTPIEIALTPVDADNKKLKYSNYDSNFIAIDENGYVIVKGPGVTDVTICSEDNENLETTVTVYATDNAPSKVKAINYGEIVKISWNKTKFSQSYEIYRSTRKEKGYEYIGSSDDLKYYDEDVSAGKIYYYKVKASNNWWDEKLSENPYSSPAMICVQTPPEQVAIKKVTSTSLKVTWTKANYATGYEIYYYDEASKKYKLLKTISDNTSVTYKKYGLKSGQTYMFKLRTFKTIDGVNYYSSFSKVLKITM